MNEERFERIRKCQENDCENSKKFTGIRWKGMKKIDVENIMKDKFNGVQYSFGDNLRGTEQYILNYCE